MRNGRRELLLKAVTLLCLGLCGAKITGAQTAPPAAASCQPSPTPVAARPNTAAATTSAAAATTAGEAGGIRIFLLDAEKKPVARRRFFLLRQSPFGAAGPDWGSMPRRSDSLTNASRELREWLARHDCDSLYCPELESEFDEAIKTVPEFRRAYEEGMRKYRNDRLARRWVTVNFPLKNVRSDYFRRKQAWLRQAAQRAGSVASFMTDRNGRALFSGIPPGDYYISNLLPFKEGGPVWDCKVTTLPPNPRQLWAVTYVLTPRTQ